MATATREQIAALEALRSRSAQSLAVDPPIQAETSAPLPAPTHQAPPAIPEIADVDRAASEPVRGRSSGSVLVSFDDAGGDAADTTQISLRLPRPHLRALRQWAAEQTMTRSDARTVTAQQIILKLIEGAVRHREGERG